MSTSNMPFNADQLLGMFKKEGMHLAETHKVPVRVEQEDGNSFSSTMEIIPGRINLQVNNGKITAIRVETPPV